MVVAKSRDAILSYYDAFKSIIEKEEEFKSIKVIYAFSPKQRDGKIFTEIEVNGEKLMFEDVMNKSEDVHIVVVNNKLMVGFDCPTLSIIYLDTKFKEQSRIVQSFSRLNRPFKDKNDVFILDFKSDGENYKHAFKRYGEVMLTRKPRIFIKGEEKVETDPFDSEEEVQVEFDEDHEERPSISQWDIVLGNGPLPIAITKNLKPTHLIDGLQMRISTLTLYASTRKPEIRGIQSFPLDKTFRYARFDDGIYAEYMIRVGFSIDLRQEIVSHVLHHGLQINEFTYTCLPISDNDVKQRKIWMWRTNPQYTKEEFVRKWGLFSRLSPEKAMKRVGQGYTKTYPTGIILKSSEVHVISDIVSKDFKYCFSDGTSIMKPELSRDIALKLGILTQKDLAKVRNRAHLIKIVPSSYQYRFSGVKGTMTIDPRIPEDSTVLLKIHKSMVKFQCNSMEIEIVKWSSYVGPARLNYQFIQNFESIGLKNPDKFLQLAQEEIDRKIQPTESSALSALGTRGPYLQQAFLSGFHNDYWIKQSLRTIKMNYLTKFVTKYSYPVRESTILLGVLDEQGILNEGEIFVQYKGRERSFIPKGPAVVGRNPTYSEKDMRLVKIVDYEGLHHLYDVVVFSSKGRRPLADEMSGGDLDGDLFFVCWNQMIVENIAWENQTEPLSFSTDTEKVRGYIIPDEVSFERRNDMYLTVSEEEQQTNEGIPTRTLNEMIKIFLRYNPILGMVSNYHMILVDQSDSGTRDPLCSEAGNLCYDLLEKPWCVDIGKSQTKKFFRKQIPDFLEYKRMIDNAKTHKDEVLNLELTRDNVYVSEKILGKLTRLAITHLKSVIQPIAYEGPDPRLLPKCSDDLDEYYFLSKTISKDLDKELELTRLAINKRKSYQIEYSNILNNYKYENVDAKKNSSFWENGHMVSALERMIRQLEKKFIDDFEATYPDDTQRIQAAPYYYYACYGGRKHIWKEPTCPQFAWLFVYYLSMYATINQPGVRPIIVSPEWSHLIKCHMSRAVYDDDEEM
eukprot:TRINITY_DN1754_c0_g2_i1.p1 TRINITY_DN1754_c0_g2~~TRINITY_DN1754_c0_g2_i1.p1  ORF type:complete len:1016 (-),score=183.21 TRINITY_DN1754_c0_g2_i1:24-3071(-)